MRTTLDLDGELLVSARRRARERGIPLTRIVEEALAAYLNPTQLAEPGYRLRWSIVRGDGQPDVDIADRDALYDRFDEPE